MLTPHHQSATQPIEWRFFVSFFANLSASLFSHSLSRFTALCTASHTFVTNEFSPNN